MKSEIKKKKIKIKSLNLKVDSQTEANNHVDKKKHFFFYNLNTMYLSMLKLCGLTVWCNPIFALFTIYSEL